MSQPATADGAAAGSWTARHPALTYTLARFVLFVVLFAVLVAIFRNLFVALITAAIVSSVVSVFALRRQRDALSMSIATRAERANQKMAERAASEDSWDEAQRQASGSSGAADDAPSGGDMPASESDVRRSDSGEL
jgi:hypothetical protein